MDKLNVLVLDDDKEIVDAIAIYLANEILNIIKAYDGLQALDIVATTPIHLILLDVMMPKLDGMKATLKIREEKNIPIILVSAKSEDTDKILGLNMGADDYISKPFAIEELLARIRAALRKRPAQAAEPPRSLLTAGPLTMDTDRHEVSVNGEGVELTRREFDLLRYLLENKERVISRESLLDHVWGFDFVGETNAVDVYIRFLRAKIDEHFGIKLIHTVRGVGYVIREEGQ